MNRNTEKNKIIIIYYINLQINRILSEEYLKNLNLNIYCFPHCLIIF